MPVADGEMGNDGDWHTPPRSPSKSASRSEASSRSRSRSRTRHSRRRSSSRDYRRRKRSRSRSRSRSYSRHSRRRSYSHDRSANSSRRRHTASRENPPPTRCLGVFGLSTYTTERDIHDFFAEYGKVEGVHLVYDHPSGRSRGFGFVYFEKTEDAVLAKEGATGAELDGQRIRIDFSITKRPHTPTPGIYMGQSHRKSFRDDYRNRSSGGGGGGGSYYSRRSRSFSASPRRK